MNPHPAAAAAAGAANIEEVLPGIAQGPPPQSTSCTTYSLGDPQVGKQETQIQIRRWFLILIFFYEQFFATSR